MKRIGTWSILAVAVLLVAGPARGLDPKVVLEKIGFPSDTQNRVLAGEFVQTSLPTSSERDLSVAISFLIEAPPESVVGQLRANMLMERVDPGTIAYGKLEGAGDIKQFEKLKLTQEQLKAYAEAKPGSDLNLSADEISALKGAGTDGKEIESKVHQLLLARYKAYRAKGLQGIATYAREGSQDDPAGDLVRVGRLVRATKVLPKEFYDLLDNYPKDVPPGLDETFYWSQFTAHGEDTIALVHVLRDTFGDDRIVMQRHFYVSTGYNTEQAIVGFLPVEKGTLVVYTNHTSTDQIAGFGGSAKRGIGRRLMATELQKLFDGVRAKVR